MRQESPALARAPEGYKQMTIRSLNNGSFAPSWSFARKAGLGLTGLVLAVAVAGCGSAATPSASRTPKPTPTPIATPTPSPTPTPTRAPTPLPSKGLTSVPKMNTGRLGQTATLLTDGRVLIAGGTTAQGLGLASAE